MKRLFLILFLVLNVSSLRANEVLSLDLDMMYKDLLEKDILYSGNKSLAALNGILDLTKSFLPEDKYYFYYDVALVERLLIGFMVYTYEELINLPLNEKVDKLKKICDGLSGDGNYQNRRDFLTFIKANLQLNNLSKSEEIAHKEIEVGIKGSDGEPTSMFEEMMRVRASLKNVGRADAEASENLAIAQAAVKYGLKVGDVRKLQDSIGDIKDRHLIDNIVRYNSDPALASKLQKAQVYFAVGQDFYKLKSSGNGPAWKTFLESNSAASEPYVPAGEAKMGGVEEVKREAVDVPAAKANNLDYYIHYDSSKGLTPEFIQKMKAGDAKNVAILEIFLLRHGISYQWLVDMDLREKISHAGDFYGEDVFKL